MAGTKRKYTQEPSSELYSNKSRAKPTVEARVDPTYGQRSALPGLDDSHAGDYEEELNYDDQDALSYLRAVRQEATAIPNLLVAPKHISSDGGKELYEDGVGDYRGWYEDGAYCAAPESSSQTSYSADMEDGEAEKGGPQIAYFDSILSRYENLRAQLQQTPPPKAVEKLDKNHPTCLGKLNTEVARWWRWKLREVDPVPAQIASMDKGTVLRLLGLMTTGTLLKRGAEVQVGVSRWAWALLARLPERGELTSEEIGIVRELGKKAVLVGMGLREEQQWEEGMDEVEAGFEEGDSEQGVVINDEEIELDVEDGYGDGEVDPNMPESELDGSTNSTNKARKFGPRMPTDYKAPESADQTEANDEAMPYTSNNRECSVEEGAVPPEDLGAAKARILAALHKSSSEEAIQEVEIQEEAAALEGRKKAARWNTKATVDMIITVAGEMFGQRDLLEFTHVWEDIDEV